MISPTVGRVVWFGAPQGSALAREQGTQPLAALVVHVHSDRCVNLAIFSPNENVAHQLMIEEKVTLLQDDDAKPAEGRFCSWMPYQTGQAQKHSEEAKADLAAFRAKTEERLAALETAHAGQEPGPTSVP